MSPHPAVAAHWDLFGKHDPDPTHYVPNHDEICILPGGSPVYVRTH